MGNLRLAASISMDRLPKIYQHEMLKVNQSPVPRRFTALWLNALQGYSLHNPSNITQENILMWNISNIFGLILLCQVQVSSLIKPGRAQRDLNTMHLGGNFWENQRGQKISSLHGETFQWPEYSSRSLVYGCLGLEIQDHDFSYFMNP